jgi:hypothetical protein
MKVIFLTLFLLLPFTSQAYDTALDNSLITQKSFNKFMFSWTVLHGDAKLKHFEVDVIHAPQKTKLSLYIVFEEERKLLSTTYIIDGFWYVIENDKVTKYRPYEAHYALPTTYYYLMKSKVQFISNRNVQFLGTYDGDEIGKHKFYRKMTNDEKEAIRKSVDLLKNKLIPEAQTRGEEAFYLERAKKLLEYAKRGKLNEVDENSGVISKLDMTDGIIEIKDFQWITIADYRLLQPPPVTTDKTQPADLKTSFLFGYNQNWRPGMVNIQTDGRIYSPKLKSMRRIPFPGAVSTPFAIDPEKELIYVTGIPINSNSVRPFVIDNKSGKSSPLGGKYLAKGQSSSLSLSPNRKMLALLHQATPSLNDNKSLVLLHFDTKQMQTISLEKSPQKVIWHPDGKSLYLATYDHEKKKSVISLISPGKLTDDIIEGAEPIILYKSKKILFLDLKDQKWKICDFDGEDPQLFEKGLERLQYPSINADESEILMILQDEENRSVPIKYNMEKDSITPLASPKGLWLSPVWSQ